MADNALLAHFAASRPEEMASALSAADQVALADFIRELPAGTDAMVAARLPSWQLTALLATLAPDTIGRMLLAASTDDAVAIVSHLSDSRYPALVEAAPEEERAALRQLLEFPTHSIASLATTAFVRVAQHTRCREFGDLLAGGSEPVAGPVVVVDGAGRYVGMVNPHALYRRRNAGRTLGDIAVAVAPLSGAADIGSALDSRLWTSYPELPVVDRQHRLLGVVNRAALLRVTGDREPAPYSVERLFADLAIGYLDTCSRVVEALIGRPR